MTASKRRVAISITDGYVPGLDAAIAGVVLSASNLVLTCISDRYYLLWLAKVVPFAENSAGTGMFARGSPGSGRLGA